MNADELLMILQLRPRDNTERDNKTIDSQRLFDLLSFLSSWLFSMRDFVFLSCEIISRSYVVQTRVI